jgi:drug/metabolite transporter superfamily protein YnfA
VDKLTQIGILLLAALFEAGGDAIVRKALHMPAGLSRLLAFGSGAVVLFLYGYMVNAPDWDFGRLLGVYVVFFFVIAQVLSWAVFNQPPTMATWIGGALIVAGGAVLGFTAA